MDSIYGTNLNEIERTRCRLNVTSHLIDEGGLPYIGHGVGIVGTVLDSRHIDTTSERREFQFSKNINCKTNDDERPWNSMLCLYYF